MPSGFIVEPDKLEAFAAKVETIVGEYQLIVGQLDEARLRGGSGGDKVSELVGVPRELGPSGPPVAFTDASRAMLINYDTLLGALRAVHAAVGARFAHMHTALGATNALYARVDDKHATAFQNLVGDRSSDGS